MDWTEQKHKAADFRELHAQTFILPNAWDAASAKVFEQCGFKAVGTTSAGIAAAHGYADRSMPFDTMLAAIREIVQAVSIPVSVDMEDGYGSTPEEVASSVRQVIESGAIGINLEDSKMNPHDGLYDIADQKKKIAAIRQSMNPFGIPVFINARTDPYWIRMGTPADMLKETLKRAKAYREAEADCVFVPGVKDIAAIRILRKEIGGPVNLLAGAGMPSLHELQSMGIERISTGSGPYRAVISLLHRIGGEMLEHGSFERITSNVLTYDDLLEL
ncbi:2-methylisocitrate lyase-like PEP mutase family enzyme [Paenibacillus rhizosphaerae]|uniref:2-methylisocitrate lyase-like PEP mutase family enzyme n=1 Tax=Paenibacillus rhizosphaerae TaxID=297318 RepID=A0A839TLJ3_9BACL|nr:isocitrate lyase/phosphoenolpyruvate mutase family protein [Paenibacillus rhizosphaerae]MBB3126600.1 2-methylisocitrate lyase-like PEP mutase family enzyme [Paenibacillus rhizosphaerae]